MKRYWRIFLHLPAVKITSVLAVFLLVINILTLPVYAVFEPLSKIPNADGNKNQLKPQENPGQVRTTIDPNGRLRLSTLPNIQENILNKFQEKYIRGSTPGVAARKSKGYIIEFKNETLSSLQIRKQQKGESGSKLRESSLNYKRELQQEHESAKKDILTKLNKQSFQAPKKETPNSVVVLQEYTTLFNGVALNITEDQVKEVKKSQFVKNAYPNYEVKTLLSESVPIIQADSAWQLKDATNRNITGQGTTIAIIDTGIDYTHPDLGGCLGPNCKVIGGYDFVNYDNDPLDDQGHGTHVAAIAAGKPASAPAIANLPFGGGGGPTPAPSPTSTPCPSPPFSNQSPYGGGGGGPSDPVVPCPNTSLFGVAPEAKLAAFKVLNNYGSGYESDVMAAVERSLDPNGDGDFSDRYTVANLSLGADCFEYTSACGPDDPLSKTVDNAVNAGLTVVVAAGNSGYYGNGTIISPGTSRKAVTVGATYKYDSLAWFSSQGPVVWKNSNISKPDVVAPGVNICAAGKFFNYDGQDISSELRCKDQNHIRLSGTSMAAPHVAGAIALIKQAHPNWSSTHLKAVLKNTAQPFATSAINRGAGRINSILSNREVHPFPLANLEPITFDSSSNIIKGRISSLNLKFWSLSYAPKNSLSLGDAASWTEFYRSTTVQSSFANLYNLSVASLPDGEYAIKLYAENSKGQKGIDYGYVNIDKLTINSPLDSDVWRAGDNLPVNITLNPAVLNKEFTFEYARVNQDKQGDTPFNWQFIAKTQNTNYNWNTQGLETGKYKFRLTMANGNVIDQETLDVYLDSTLRAGWPIRIAADQDELFGNIWPIWPGFTVPVVSDLDNDGKQEIVVFAAGNPPKLKVYQPDGTLKWDKEVGKGIVDGWDIYAPVIADINNDGKKEIIAYNSNSNSYFDDPKFSELYAFTSDGNILSGWPVRLPGNFQITMLAADIDNDKQNEVIIQGWSGDDKLTIVKGDGSILSQWSLPKNRIFSNLQSTPAVGNFDDDADLEIVVARPPTNYGETRRGIMFVFNKDGSAVPGWPIETDSVIMSAPAVGDINNDGKEDIVVGLRIQDGGVYVFDRDGKVLPGWPVGKGKDYWSSPSLGDLDGDGKLEIAVSALWDFSTEVYKANGELLPGWPKRTERNDYYSTIIGDVNGDKIADIITTAGNKVYAWKADGTAIAGFPKITEKDAQASATLADIDNDGKLELIASSDNDFDWLRRTYKERNSIYVWNLNSNIYPQTMYWPMFHRDAKLTGRYAFPLSGAKRAPCARTGDIDLDGYITSADAVNFTSDVTHVKRMVAALPDPETGLPYTNEQKLRADVNNDQKVSVADAVKLLGYVNGAVEISDFPACSQPTPTSTPTPSPSSTPVATSSATPTPTSTPSALLN